MRLAGIELTDSLVLELAALLRGARFTDVAETLERAFVTHQLDVALTIPEREQILRVLDGPPDGPLARLRGVLLEEHVGRIRDGLA